jgi:chemotaxis family two-component system response regulator Rcp1
MLHILLIEDFEPDVFLVTCALKAHVPEHHLSVVRDGQQAVQVVGSIGKPGGLPCPDVLLLDMNRPTFSGAGVLAAFRKHPDCASTPVVVISSYGAHMAEVAHLNVHYHFEKPLDLEEFLELGHIVADVCHPVLPKAEPSRKGSGGASAGLPSGAPWSTRAMSAA